MELEFIPLARLFVDKANMRHGKTAPDVSDILPSVRQRGIVQTLLVKPANADGMFGIVAGARRFHAAKLARAEAEARGEKDSDGWMAPCAILEDGDDAAALEASLIENCRRRDPDEVTQWESFVRLVKAGRTAEEISRTFGIPPLGVSRILALGNLLPRIRTLYRREEIDAVTVRQLTLASKSQQKAWLALFDDPDSYCPSGYRLKDWLFGGQAIRPEHALFDAEASGLAIVGDLFGEERYFADADAFWAAQEAAIEARAAEYLEAGWREVVRLPRGEYFRRWDHARLSRSKGGRVYVELRANGETAFHEGYVTMKEARRLESGAPLESAADRQRSEITGPMQAYIDLHRHAAVRAALTGHPCAALRMMAAHAICGSPLWQLRCEPQAVRSEAIRESVESCKAEASFDERRRAVLALLGLGADELNVAGAGRGEDALVGLFLTLLGLPDETVMEIVAVVMGETLASGSAAVEVLGGALGVDMADWWEADDAFLALVRERELLGALLAEIGGSGVAEAHKGEKAATIRTVIRDHLAGTGGRCKAENWVPRWMAFPPSAYTERGGVGTVAAHDLVEAVRGEQQARAGGEQAGRGEEAGEAGRLAA